MILGRKNPVTHGIVILGHENPYRHNYILDKRDYVLWSYVNYAGNLYMEFNVCLVIIIYARYYYYTKSGSVIGPAIRNR